MDLLEEEGFLLVAGPGVSAFELGLDAVVLLLEPKGKVNVKGETGTLLLVDWVRVEPEL